MQEKKGKERNVIWTSVTEEVMKKIDQQREKERRTRPQMVRIILEDYYTKREGKK